MFNNNKARIAELEAALEEQTARLDGMERVMADRAALVSITTPDNYTMRLTFVRNGQLTTADFHRSMSLDVQALRKTLLERR